MYDHEGRVIVVDDARRPFARETGCYVDEKIRARFVPGSCRAVRPRSLVHYKKGIRCLVHRIRDKLSFTYVSELRLIYPTGSVTPVTSQMFGFTDIIDSEFLLCTTSPLRSNQ